EPSGLDGPGSLSAPPAQLHGRNPQPVGVTMTRSSQRGSAMLVAMILMAALLAGATVLVTLQMSSNRNTELTKTGITALYCAEGGLISARAAVAENPASSNDQLGTKIQTSWLPAEIANDLDGDGAADVEIILEDNFDEPGTDNPNVDSDGKIFIVSK